ncbi:immunity protein Imm33 domain-containing protein [Parachitinimonas caeni]|uniref:Imm33-like domain-containing protein n=1 Tax=Parachitinimonas caeni TaxID=3031301 RepID=A0ABT7E425_9NEIS|nr:hypothetical protein [Parachitinimonas caeni]MDK2127072.1 hypothetical protein [Parachitinimonas caeni]
MEITTEQRDVCAKYNSPEFEIDEGGMVAVALSSIGKNPIYGTRIEKPENGNVSWFFYCGDYSEAPDFFQPIHTSHLDEILPSVKKYLFLSPGFKFIIDDEGYEDVWMEGAED